MTTEGVGAGRAGSSARPNGPGTGRVFPFGVGFANLVAVAFLAWLTIDGFASLWCGYAAITSGAIAFHMRYGRPHRSAPYVLT